MEEANVATIPRFELVLKVVIISFWEYQKRREHDQHEKKNSPGSTSIEQLSVR
jgi:hypothetical protein